MINPDELGRSDLKFRLIAIGLGLLTSGFCTLLKVLLLVLHGIFDCSLFGFDYPVAKNKKRIDNFQKYDRTCLSFTLPNFSVCREKQMYSGM